MGQAMNQDTPDLTRLDDCALIAGRAEPERLPPRPAGYQALSRARDALAGMISGCARAARVRAS
jgi:hypothetical protein